LEPRTGDDAGGRDDLADGPAADLALVATEDQLRLALAARPRQPQLALEPACDRRLAIGDRGLVDVGDRDLRHAGEGLDRGELLVPRSIELLHGAVLGQARVL